jgi:hypothetical protein
MKDNEMTGEMLRMLPSHISDESAVVLCNFLAELLRLLRGTNPTVTPQIGWVNEPESSRDVTPAD